MLSDFQGTIQKTQTAMEYFDAPQGPHHGLISRALHQLGCRTKIFFLARSTRYKADFLRIITYGNAAQIGI